MPDAPTSPLDPEEVADALLAAVARVAALIDRVTDPTAMVPGNGEWTVRDLLAHLAGGPAFYLGGSDGTTRFAQDGAEMPEINATNISAIGDRSVTELRDDLVTGCETLAARVRAEGRDAPRWPAHGGHRVRLLDAAALLLGELAMHGLDLARAVQAPWTISARDAELIMWGAAPIIPAWVNPATAAGHTADYEIRLRGQGRHRWRFTNGALTVEPEGPWRPDVVISGAPATLLMVFYGRIGQYGPMLRGQLLAWGRKPWLALGMPKLLLPA